MIFLLKKHNREILNFILIWLVSFDATWYFWPGRLKWFISANARKISPIMLKLTLCLDFWENTITLVDSYKQFYTLSEIRLIKSFIDMKDLWCKCISICFAKTEPFTYSDCYHITSYVPRFMNTSLQNCHVQCRMEGTLHMAIGVLSI